MIVHFTENFVFIHRSGLLTGGFLSGWPFVQIPGEIGAMDFGHCGVTLRAVKTAFS